MTLCGFEITPGEKRQVKLPVLGGAPLEAWLLCGAHPGKTLVVTAGVHGCEYVGILALQKLVEMLDCATLFGQVILLPLKSATTDPITDKGFMIVFLPLLQVIGRISIKFVTVLFAKVYCLFGSIHRSLPLFPVISLVNQKSAVGVFKVGIKLTIPID